MESVHIAKLMWIFPTSSVVLELPSNFVKLIILATLFATDSPANDPFHNTVHVSETLIKCKSLQYYFVLFLFVSYILRNILKEDSSVLINIK